jgi:hypothetical protein
MEMFKVLRANNDIKALVWKFEIFSIHLEELAFWVKAVSLFDRG